ncbi:hypothetical protein [Streptomyces sp. NBC_01718]|uniref:hypothetical protein n=1 Tax=Streptomyces sp. NBC_01718 TaxID=2975919 RepID=UPI00352E844B
MNHRAALADLDAMAYVIIRPAPAADDNDDLGTYAVEAASLGMSKRAAAYALRQVADRFDADAAAVGDQPLDADAIAEANARNAQRPAGLDALLDHVAANLPAAAQPDTVESLLDELADDIPNRRAHAIAADYLARFARLLAAAIAADSRQRGQEMRAAGDRRRVATCGGMQIARRILDDHADRLNGETGLPDHAANGAEQAVDDEHQADATEAGR